MSKKEIKNSLELMDLIESSTSYSHLLEALKRNALSEISKPTYYKYRSAYKRGAAFVMVVKILEFTRFQGQQLTRVQYDNIDAMLAGIVDDQEISKIEFLFLLECHIGKMSEWYKRTPEDFLLYGAQILN